MNGAIYQISPAKFIHMMDPPVSEEVIEAARLSTDILVGMFNAQPLCFIGLAPRSLITDSAYVWMITTQAGQEHSLLLARYAKGFVDVITSKYSCIFGQCFNDRSKRWLEHLGAEFTSLTEFEIRRV